MPTHGSWATGKVDATSIYFEARGGETIGARRENKDHRADLKTLIPVVDRLRRKFGIGRVCIVANRGIIGKRTIAELQESVRDVRIILGDRMRAVKEVREVVLARRTPHTTRHPFERL